MSTRDAHIIELADGQAGGFEPRGAVAKLWETTHVFERMVSGPADTGKTYGCLQYLDALLWRYPGSQAVMCRKTYNSLIGTCLRTYLRILGPDSPVKAFGGERPQWFDYPNGSRLWLVGLDNPGKVLSAERDFIYVNQAEELASRDWEILTTRASGRGAVAPHTCIFGDCNPKGPTHWIRKRSAHGGPLLMLESRHEDNPTLYDRVDVVTPAGKRYEFKLTPDGRKRMRVLDNLTGADKQRLRFGRWVQAEGVVYASFDEARHVIDRMPKGWRSWRKIRSIDWGYNNPFVCQWWAIDPDGRMYLYREMYMSYRIVEDHVKGWKDPDDPRRTLSPGVVSWSEGEAYETTVADHDLEDRMTAAKHGVRTAPAKKDVQAGINVIEERLKLAGDGRPRIFFLRDCTVEVDERMRAARKPTSTVGEFDVYLLATAADGKPLKEKPVDADNHGMDAMRYAGMHEARRGSYRAVSEPAVAGGNGG